MHTNTRAHRVADRLRGQIQDVCEGVRVTGELAANAATVDRVVIHAPPKPVVGPFGDVIGCGLRDRLLTLADEKMIVIVTVYDDGFLLTDLPSGIPVYVVTK